MRNALVIALLACATPTVAQHGNLDGNGLFEMCVGGNTDICIGFIMGAANVLAAAEAPVFNYRICIPANATVQQVSDTVVQWLDQNPGDRHFSAPSLIEVALFEAFPCE